MELLFKTNPDKLIFMFAYKIANVPNTFCDANRVQYCKDIIYTNA